MARMEEWQREALDALRREDWALKGYNAIVKVVPTGDSRPYAAGYITLGKNLINKTPPQIVRDLGLDSSKFIRGMRVYRLTRLPQITEYDFELSAAYPGGVAYVPGLSDPRFPAGSGKVLQWKIREGTQIPVDTSRFIELKPSDVFPSAWL
ncbi:hypothetical protein [uncultured Paludibaculum sp.]|uniref:hypothetical protein n=1 Tax=uncultured Paludibaculum sp. TaxID=1765020 RepID=UPI002AAB95C5|nr:hypothetical protein [uncultured Paludibaculum sp.]